MIAKAIKGTSFRGVLRYNLGKDEARLLDSNLDAEKPDDMAREFNEIHQLRPRLGKAVLHVALSASPGEHLSDAQWTAVAHRYLDHMGCENNQYVVVKHEDTDHEHIHLVINRVRFDGTVTSDSNDYRRQEVLMRQLEKELALQPVRSSRETPRHAATKGEIEQSLRTGEASVRQKLQLLCDAAVVGSASFTDYAGRLASAGVRVTPMTQLEGRKLNGLTYTLDGVTMKGSDLGKGYTPAGLAKRGVSYVKERDLEAVGRCLEQGAPGRVAAADRAAASRADIERGGAGRPAGAAGTSDGDPDRGNRKNHAARRTEPDQAAHAAYASGPGDEQEPGADRSRSPDLERPPRERSLFAGLASLFARDHVRSAGRAAYDRILALARTILHRGERGLEGDRGRDQARSQARIHSNDEGRESPTPKIERDQGRSR